MKIHRISGAKLTDDIFSITLQTGEFVCWNVTKLQRAAKAGFFGPPVYAKTCDLPSAKWEAWGAEDRETVDWIKANADVLNEPAIAIASPRPEYFVNCFADGQHRITARQELRLDEVSFYVVPIEKERAFRVEGFPPAVAS
jgi:hypothetical protein